MEKEPVPEQKQENLDGERDTTHFSRLLPKLIYTGLLLAGLLIAKTLYQFYMWLTQTSHIL